MPKKPRTSDDYVEHYTNVLPSRKVIADTKHLLSIQQERNAALALIETSEEESMTTLHYDTTTRKRINGEWPSLILRMESGKKFRLRPLSLAVEDRQNITKLLVTMLKQMAIAGKISAS